jgi:hypothetical protein
VAGDDLGQEATAGPQDPPGLGQRREPVAALDELVERAHEQDCVDRSVVGGEIGGGAQVDVEGSIGLLAGPAPGPVRVPGDGIDQVTS